MKRSKKILALVAVLAVVSIATFAVTRYEEKQEDIRAEDLVILEIAADSVESLSWAYTDEGLGFHKTEDGWHYDDDEAFPVSRDKVNDILSNFEALSAAFIIENPEDYSQYGLDDPECVIKLGTAEQSYEIKLGNFSTMDRQRYVDTGDGNVYLVGNDPVNFLASSLSGMIEHDDTPGFENVVDINFSGSENYSIVKIEDSTDSYHPDDIYFAQLDDARLPLSTDYVTDYLNTVTSLELLNFASYNATVDELESYGLAEPELSVTINYSYTDEDDEEVSDSCVFHIGQNVEDLEAYDAAVEAEEELPDVRKYVRIGDSQIIYELDDISYITLSGAGYDDLRHRQPFWGSFDTVTGIDISLEGESHSLVSEMNEKEEIRTWYYEDEELDISKLQATVENLSADSFTDEVPDEKLEISLTLYLDNENFPQLDIELYRYDGSQCLAVVDGESVSMLDRSAVMKLVEAVQAIVLD